MDKILLQQHFFGSVPAGHGLTGNRGFQTIGRSAGAGEERLLEEHCDYEPPEDHAGGPLPVNWGWFERDDGRACLHRIGDAGTDEIGRTGNFLAHNLITSASELEAIDYDIPALFRWVTERSPIRYPSDSGGEDGFASYPWQVNERLGTEPDQLGSIPPLEVPLAEVRAIRERMDRQLGPETVSPLRASLGRGGMGALLAAFLCPREARRPVVVRGLGDGSEYAAAQRRLVEFLFAVLPYHYRRRLSYATYAHWLPIVDDLSSSAPAHRRRRLVVSGPGDDGPAGVGRRGSSAWIVGGNGVRHQVPEPPAKLARQYEEWLDRDSGLSRILAVRSVAGHFAFDDELQGLQDGWRWAALRDAVDFGSREAELFARTAPAVRDAWPEVIAAGSRAVATLDTRAEFADQLLPGVVTGYLLGVGRVLPGMPAGVRERHFSSVSDDLSGLLSLAVAMERWGSMRELISGVCDGPAFASVRPQALAGFSETLEQRLVGDNSERLAAAWTALSEGCERGAADTHVRAFRVRTASYLMRLLLSRRMKQRSDRLASVLDTLVIPVLLEAPFAAPDELLDRFAFLEEVSGENRARCCGRFIVELSRGGSLDSDVLERIARENRSLVLRFCEAWKEAVQVAPSKLGPIQRLLEEPELVAAYWRTPWRERDPLMDRGLLTRLAEYRSAAERERAHRLALLYASEGGGSLARDLEEDDRTRIPSELTIMAAAHCALLDTVLIGRGRGETPPVRDHLTRLLAYLLTGPLAGTSDPGAIRGMIEKPAEQAARWFPEVGAQTQFLEEAAWSVHRICATARPPLGSSTDRLRGFQETLVNSGIDLMEARWHTERFRIATELPAEGGAGETARRSISAHTTANLLLEFPEVAASDRHGEFAQYLRERLDGAVWAELSRQLVVECGGRNRSQCSLRWFVPESPRGVLLDRLEGEGWLDKAAKALSGRLSGLEPVDAAILALEELLDLGPRDAVAEPARRRLLDLVTRRLDALVPADPAAPISLPRRAEAMRDVALCPPVLRLGMQLGRARLELLWSRLGQCLAVLGPEELHRLFPPLFALGCRLSEWLGEEQKLWLDLFRPTFSSHFRPLPSGNVLGTTPSDSKSRSIESPLHRFAIACEALFNVKEDGIAISEGIDSINMIHNSEEYSNVFYIDNEHPRLLLILGHGPDSRYSIHPQEDAFRSTIRRALLATTLFAPHRMEDLAGVFHELGLSSNRSSWNPNVTAFALTGFLTMRGSRSDAIRSQLQSLNTKFWRAFRPLCMRTGGTTTLTQTLENCLIRLAVPHHVARKASDKFRAELRPWYKRLFGRSGRLSHEA